MGLMNILFGKSIASTAPDFLGTDTKDYKKIKNMAETILDSTSATAEQRQKANKWLKEANRRLK